MHEGNYLVLTKIQGQETGRDALKAALFYGGEEEEEEKVLRKLLSPDTLSTGQFNAANIDLLKMHVPADA